jgi:hypothetical protein
VVGSDVDSNFMTTKGELASLVTFGACTYQKVNLVADEQLLGVIWTPDVLRFVVLIGGNTDVGAHVVPARVQKEAMR